MSKPVSLTVAAATLGLSRNTLSAWIAKGCPVVSKADRDQGVEWELDVAAIHEWRVETAVKDALASYQDTKGGISREEADRRRAVANARLAEAEADERVGSLVLVSDAMRSVTDFAVALKINLGNASNKIAGRAASMKHAVEIEDLCHAELNRAFDAAQASLKERWGED